MQKYFIYFGLLMSLVYVAAGCYFLLGSIFGWTTNTFKYQNILGGVLIGYGLFRMYRGIQKNNTTRNIE